MRGGASRPVLETLRASFKVLRYLMLVLVLLYLGSGIFIVGPEEVAFILRFGKITGNTPAERIKKPGIYYALPFPIDHVERVAVKEVRELDLADLWHSTPTGDRMRKLAEGKKKGKSKIREDVSSVEEAFLPSIDPTREGYCITGDHNIVQPRLTVKYKVGDPEKFVFNNYDPEALVSSVAYREMIHAISQERVDWVLRAGQGNLAVTIGQAVQAALGPKGLDTGIDIVAVEFKEVTVPRHVVKDFQMVLSAYIQRETKKGEAYSYAKSEIPKAQSEAAGMVTDAQAYAQQQVAKAQGEKAQFEALLDEYHRSPRVVKERLYREALEGIFGAVGRRIFVSPTKKDRVRVWVPTEGD